MAGRDVLSRSETDELHFRSPLLDALPRAPRAYRPTRMLGRLLWLSLGMGVLLLLSWLILSERIAKDTWLAGVAYGFHDHIFLPLRGWLFTRFFPYSLIVWALVLGAIGSWLYTTVTGIPLFRGRHLRWTRWALRRPSLHTKLFKAARATRKFGVEPVFLQSVLEHELTANLGALAAEPPGSDSPLPARISGLLRLRSELEARPSRPPKKDEAPKKMKRPMVSRTQRLETLCLWIKARRILRLHGGDTAITDLNELAPAILDPLLVPATGRAIRGPADFTPETLTGDALRLAIADGAIPADVWRSQGIEQPASELRQRLLERLGLIESWSLALREGRSAEGVPSADEGEPGNRTSPSQCARLFVDLALDVAARDSSAVFARELLDPLDGLRFLLRAGGERLRTPNRADIAMFLDRLPRPTDYRASAILESRALRRLGEAAERANLFKTPLFTPEDLQRARERAEDIAMAAGP